MDHILIVSQAPEAILPFLPRGCTHHCVLPSSGEGASGGKAPCLVIADQLEDDQLEEQKRHHPGVPIILILRSGSHRHGVSLGGPGSIIAPPLESSLPPALRCWLPSLATRHLLEPSTLAKLYQMGGRSLADRMLDGFLKEGPATVSTCLEDWRAGRADAAARGLTHLHERAGRVGATTLQDLSAQLEERIHRGDEPAELMPLWAQLEGTMQAVVRMLEQQRRQERTA